MDERIIEVQRCDKELIETLHKVHEGKMKKAKSEAVKEFAERLKKKQFCFGTFRGEKLASRYAVDVSDIDKAYEEMVDDEK